MPPSERFARVHAVAGPLRERIISACPSAKTIYPVAHNDAIRVFLAENLARIARDARPRMPEGHIRAADVRGYLAKEIRAAFDLMAGPDQPGSGLDDVEAIDGLATTIATRAFEGKNGEIPDHLSPASQETNDLAQLYPALIAGLPGNLRQRSLGALCLAVAVESALLDRQIRAEVRRMAACGRIACSPEWDSLRFYRPRPDAASAGAFEAYVRCRWPAVAFALDPVADEQNIADAARLGRGLQLASAFAATSGHAGGKALAGYLRQVARGSVAIGLNRTVVAFAHGNDAFGWRFAPRYQNPPAPAGPVHAFGQAATGSLGADPRAQARLEPGMRELTVAVLLPSFLPRARLEAAGSWQPLDDPGRNVFDSDWVLSEGRAVLAARRALAAATDAGCYRPADVAGLAARLDRLEARLPAQSYAVGVPYQNALGGFELFTPGSTALRPELTGYEGVPEVGPPGGDVLLLSARNVDLAATRVIIGGRQACPEHTEILSRELIRVAVPPGARPVASRGPTQWALEAYLATPNGVSNRLTIPFSPPIAPPPAGPPAPPPALTDKDGPFHRATEPLPPTFDEGQEGRPAKSSEEPKPLKEITPRSLPSSSASRSST